MTLVKVASLSRLRLAVCLPPTQEVNRDESVMSKTSAIEKYKLTQSQTLSIQFCSA